jgi:hypothetical protein
MATQSKQSKQPAPRKKVTLSKLSKIRAAGYINPHERGAYIRSMLAAENYANMTRYSKNSTPKDTDSN